MEAFSSDGPIYLFFFFISFGGKTLYIMAIGKRLGITQHVIWPGGSSCHFSLAVAGSHAKGCNMFLFSPLRTHVLFPLTALLFSPPAQPKSDQIHATSYCTKTLVRYSKGPPRIYIYICARVHGYMTHTCIYIYIYIYMCED